MTRRDSSFPRVSRPLIVFAVASAAAIAGCGGHHTRKPDPVAQGRRLFVTEGCGACHAAAAAHTHGRIGPSFDTSEPLTRAQIRRQLGVGEGGMPSFRGRLTRAREDALVEFVFQTVHRSR